jgi:hypothetical protein
LDDPFLDPIEIQQRNQSAKAIAGAAVDDVKKEPTKERTGARPTRSFGFATSSWRRAPDRSRGGRTCV